MGPKYLGKLLSWISLLVRLFWAMLGHRPSSNPSPSCLMDSNIVKSSLSSRRIYKYDVFLSFRGTDTRNSFTNHLYAHLIRKGIFTFKDDKKLEKGKPISPQLLQAIIDSRVSIIIFSKDYAGSTWCLEEMATIADCLNQLKQVVFSVFYNVDPSHVRNQTGVYENAFVLHTEKFKQVPGKVDRWKRAMSGFGNSVGWDVRDKPEFEEIEKLVQKVIETLDHKFSGFADDLIGIQPRVERLEKLMKLNSKDDDFQVLGIWGMGGIGKTTHATVLYDKISYQFDACCFIENVSKIYRDGGVIAVQKQILRQTLDEKNLEIYSPSEISGIIRNRLSRIKVLIVLDNVDELEQLEKLAINLKLLGSGSRMIITTRDEHILKVYGADAIHKVPLLNNNDAHKLFCRKAFNSDDSSSSCVELTPKVLKYAQRLPLAIRVVGSFLCTRDATQWRDTLDRLRSNPDKKIMDVLQISFEGLHSDDKEIFLHIACFFKGEREDYVRRILFGCGLHPHIGIPVIIEKSLITIRNQEIHMHEMLQELGKKIVRQQFPREPASWTRLWLYQDFHHVLMTETGTNNVKAIVLDQKEDVSKFSQLRAEGLSKMKDLRLLILYHKNFSGSLNFLSNSLQYLLWHGYPFTSLPLNFQPTGLVELNMPDSRIEQLWEGIKYLPYLKRMDLSNSRYLIKMPSFEGIPILERLDLTGCTNLSQLHSSIGLLKELSFLSLRNCSSLVSLDLDSVSNLCYLRVLHLSGCIKLENTPNFTSLSNLEYLDLEQCTSLFTVHESVGVLAQLKFLSLRHCTNLVIIPDSINTLASLKTLDLCGCLKLSYLPPGHFRSDDTSMSFLTFLDVSFCNLRTVPHAIGELRHLERLNLEGNNFVSVPDTIEKLSSLAYLNLSHCHELQSLPEIPLDSASSGGRYFKMVSGSRNHRSGLYIFDCPKLTDNGTTSYWLLKHVAISWLIRLVQQPCHFRCGFDIVVPGSIIPEWWFNHQFKGSSIIRIGDSNVDDNWIGFDFYVAFEVNNCSAISGSSHNSFSTPLSHPFYLSFESEQAEESFDIPLRLDLHKVDGSEYLWLIHISRPHCHFVKTGACITFKACPGLKMRKWGLRKVFFGQYIDALKWDSSYLKFWRDDVEVKLRNEFLKTGEGNQVDRLLYDYVDESSSSSSGPKIRLPFNWLVTEEEENENMEAKEKENNVSNMGL